MTKKVKNLDDLFSAMLDFYKSINAASICFAQAGDFLGGINNGFLSYRFSKRKAMNSFFCSTLREFKFISRLNEDVNTYSTLGSRGTLFITVPYCAVFQTQTQKTSGGMTDAYRVSGTYVKSFYSVMYCPSFVRIGMMKSTNKRIHHSFDWDKAVPCIIREKYKLKS